MHSIWIMTFADELRAHCATLKMGKPALAKCLGISLRAYYNYESGLRVPPTVMQEGIRARIMGMLAGKSPVTAS